MTNCELCVLDVPTVVANDKFAVIIVDDANYPGFCRVIWREHVREMSDLKREDRLLLNEAVYELEQAVREVMAPHKINVASLGNVVPHLHWHVIPRYTDDAHFPAPVWANAVRETDAAVLDARRALLPQLADAIARRFNRT
ncbi:HIT family protein [Massilia sp. Mn16-1_5]|uniref:HIT family protein n=1 Tax=Massilia sp. Mn16-1_5 TaxID=2079199 RepID=UPI00109EDFCD|nr:HIT family protein [Massilia sp. Mn16-1_5]THC44229.1 HIT family protein [Massilia sp. Mn16-1_5]